MVSVSFINNTKSEGWRILVASFLRFSLQTQAVARLALWAVGIHKAALKLNAAATTAHVAARLFSRNRRVASSTLMPTGEKPTFCRAAPSAFDSFCGPSLWINDFARPGFLMAGSARGLGGRFVVRVNVHSKNPACGERHAAKGWSGMNAVSDTKLME